MAESKGGGAPEYKGFSEEDLQKVLHEETCTSEAEGWSLCSKTETAEVWKKHCPDEAIHLIKGFLYFPGIPPEGVVKMIHDLKLRKRWDTQFPVIDVLEEHPTHRVVYWLVSMPPPVLSRDLVQYISEKRDESTNTTYILYSNAPDNIVPHKFGIIRAATILSASIVRPDPTDPRSTRMTVLLQNDAKGLIPKFIINSVTAKAPGQWRDNLYNFYVDVYSKEVGSPV